MDTKYQGLLPFLPLQVLFLLWASQVSPVSLFSRGTKVPSQSPAQAQGEDGCWFRPDQGPGSGSLALSSEAPSCILPPSGCKGLGSAGGPGTGDQSGECTPGLVHAAEDLCPALHNSVIMGNGPFMHCQGTPCRVSVGGAPLPGCLLSPKVAGVHVPYKLRILNPIPQSSTLRLRAVSGLSRPLANTRQAETRHRVWGLSAFPVPKCSSSVRPLRMF